VRKGIKMFANLKLKILAARALRNNRERPGQHGWLKEMSKGNFPEAYALLPDDISQRKIEKILSPSLCVAANALRERFGGSKTSNNWKKYGY
jgi:hypothetical protein